jgi:hypothetical protein
MINIRYSTPVGPLYVAYDPDQKLCGLAFSKDKSEILAQKQVSYASEGLPPFMFAIASTVPRNAKMNLSRIPLHSALINLIPDMLLQEYDFCFVKDNTSNNYAMIVFDLIDRNREILYFWSDSLLNCIFQFIIRHHYDLDKPSNIWDNGSKKKHWTALYLRGLPVLDKT